MSPAWIRKRPLPETRKRPKGGASFQVLYRRGGRETPILSAGTFQRDRDAKLRRDLVAGWLAQGLDPRTEIEKLLATASPRRSFYEDGVAMIASRHDAADNTVRGKRKALDKVKELKPELVRKPAVDWTVADVQGVVAAMVKSGLAPSTIDKYVTDGVKLVIDFADVTPNVARDRRVRIPSQVRAEVEPPTASQVLAILSRVPQRLVLPLIVLEQTAMRIGELVTLPWADVDVVGCRFRLSRERVKTRHPRWVQVPDWLMAIIDSSCAAEDRTETRLVFSVSESTLRMAMARACRAAGIPLYSPHDLRHRRASLWHGQGVTVAELKQRGGWSRGEIALDTYSHVMPLKEVGRKELRRVLVRTR